MAIEETLSVLQDFVREGKVRHVGVSNETPWGVAQFLKHAENQGLPRIVSIQNAYSLLNRVFESGLSEFSRHEDVGLLAYSPLAMGMLCGKYLDGARPEGARLTRYERFTRYSNPQAEAATAEYVALARRLGLSPTHLALAFINQQPFVTSNLIGATALAQLRRTSTAWRSRCRRKRWTASRRSTRAIRTRRPEAGLSGARPCLTTWATCLNRPRGICPVPGLRRWAGVVHQQALLLHGGAGQRRQVGLADADGAQPSR